MEFKRDDCTFTVPDRPNVKQQMDYRSAVDFSDEQNHYFKFWKAALRLIDSWQCELIPDYHVDAETLTNPKQATIMAWAGMEVVNFINSLDDVPKNS